jgi:hypothetical protein
LHPVPTDRAGVVLIGERRDHEVAAGDAADLTAGLLDDADELVPHGRAPVRGGEVVVGV